MGEEHDARRKVSYPARIVKNLHLHICPYQTKCIITATRNLLSDSAGNNATVNTPTNSHPEHNPPNENDTNRNDQEQPT